MTQTDATDSRPYVVLTQDDLLSNEKHEQSADVRIETTTDASLQPTAAFALNNPELNLEIDNISQTPLNVTENLKYNTTSEILAEARYRNSSKPKLHKHQIPYKGLSIIPHKRASQLPKTVRNEAETNIALGLGTDPGPVRCGDYQHLQPSEDPPEGK